ncbi:uncharacterized protein [Miscanthus floridulus]|uniref:uncharacterized protein n=1 Tax=Miscanthus floridulus TaxID=154761 RepID=UPI00345790AF
MMTAVLPRARLCLLRFSLASSSASPPSPRCWYFTFAQGFAYLAPIRLQGFMVKYMVNPWRAYMRLLVLLMGSNGLTKGSLASFDYPAEIKFRSTKCCIVHHVVKFFTFMLCHRMCFGTHCYGVPRFSSWTMH